MKTMKKLYAILLAAAVCAAWPAMAQTDSTPPSTNAPVARKRVPTTFRGTITGVDSAGMILSLKGRPGSPDNKVKITSKTKIQKDGQPAQFSDAVEGMRVNGSGKRGEDKLWTATTLNIMTKPRAPKPAAAASTPAAPQ